jgi:predicted O-methyltransferase YrrM
MAGAGRALRRARPATLDDAIEFAERFEYARISVRPVQVASEIRDFLGLLADDPPGAILEIGTAQGGTLFLLSRIARDNATLVSIDLPADTQRAQVNRSLGRARQRVVFLAADSHRSETHAEVVEVLGGKQLDLLFIDGDHTRAGVEADFRMYAPLVRKGGLVALHDIVPGRREAVGGVPDFWQEIRTDGAIEFVEDWAQGGWGIGVLRR